MIEGFELTWWDENGGNSIDLEDWQIFAIQQVLGIEIIPQQNGYEIRQFTKQVVAERLKKMGILKQKDQE
jgi:hypothetical protein